MYVSHFSYHTQKKGERKEQLHNRAEATAAPSGGFSQVSLPHFEHESYYFGFLTQFFGMTNYLDFLADFFFCHDQLIWFFQLIFLVFNWSW